MRKFQHLNISRLYDLDSLTEWLRIEGLPHADLDEPDREFFQLEQGDQLVGYAGVEGSTADRLLRSFFVLPLNRGGGIGSEALKSVETLLMNKGVQSLHLLTTTAAPFFERHGFNIVIELLRPPPFKTLLSSAVSVPPPQLIWRSVSLK